MQGEYLEDSYHLNVIINMLVRFPEIFTITYNLPSSSYSLSYMLNGKVDRERYIELRRLLEENLEAYHYFMKKEHYRLTVRKKSFSNLTRLEVILPGDRLIDNEISLITNIILDSFGNELISEWRAEDGDAYLEAPATREELLEFLLNRNSGSTVEKLFAFRESGKVYVFDQ